MFPLTLALPSGTTSKPPEPGTLRLGLSLAAITRALEIINTLERVSSAESRQGLRVASMYVFGVPMLSSYSLIIWQRLGMAHLMGQLDLPARPDIALPLLQRAATLATIQVAQPAYVYGLLLLGEFSQAVVPPHFFSTVLPPGVSPQLEARKHLERAAHLNFSPAQYKLGHAYEFAEPPFPFDALLSVQYYSLASQQGEIEADMALSKWFLCGAEGAFDKDESLAYTFAEKAARKGLPSAEFALGYYTEVGVGGPKDIDAARRWYQRVTFIIHSNLPLAKQLYFDFD
jgi:hypothetical protein